MSVDAIFTLAHQTWAYLGIDDLGGTSLCLYNSVTRIRKADRPPKEYQ
jgi:hypothetical protein